VPAGGVWRRFHVVGGRRCVLGPGSALSSVGFLFPGQGSQLVGMGRDFAEALPWARDLYSLASEMLGFDLADVCFNGPEEALRQTRATQPALVVHGVIAARLLREKGIVPALAAGHSLGEYSALIACGALSFEDGLALVRERSRLMSEAGSKHPGAMAAIVGLRAAEVEAACREAADAGPVQPANFNSPDQTVISGSREAVAKAMEIAKAKGAKRAIELAVSGAFHSPLMDGAARDFEPLVRGTAFRKPAFPVVQNATAAAADDPAAMREAASAQMTHSVRWVETVQAMIGAGVTTFYEAGPGRVLAGLVKRIDGNAAVIPCGTLVEISAIPA
jgi:[acyl-carrier-protein] S-malonyltransferase